MQWLNYHHLLYFYVVAREGSIARACEELQLAQPTISNQLRRLERALGEKLFNRRGRYLVLTEVGQTVYGYAEEIFGLGRELLDTLGGQPTARPMRLTVGVADALPKLVTYRLLQPALQTCDQIRLVCREGKPNELFAELAVHGLDLVLSDVPITPGLKIRAFNHLVGECSLSVCGVADLAGKYRKGFPGSLTGAPVLLPTNNTSQRRLLEQWFDAEGIRPQIAGEFEDSALLKVFAQAGAGVFAIPAIIEDEVCRQYGVRVIGRIETLRERFYAVSVERRLKHPAVVAILEAARQTLPA
jgi:LysR family transcriptional activator of nhaA